LPGLGGKDGAILSSACTPVISSIDTVRVGTSGKAAVAFW
jgi:hypothetical protein